MRDSDPSIVHPAGGQTHNAAPYVCTQYAIARTNSAERWVDIIDSEGGMVSIPDDQLLSLLVLLMRHLNGEHIRLVDQDIPDDLRTSAELEEARVSTAQQIAALQARYTTLVVRQHAIAEEGALWSQELSGSVKE